MFVPIRDNNPTFRKPILTVTLIVLNSLIFIYSWMQGPDGFERFLRIFGFTPDFYLNAGSIYELPGWYYATPLTSMFLHGGWMHLIGNMLFLWIFGNNIEDYFGPVLFLAFYLLAGIAAVALYTAFNPDSQIPLVGASGAIAGVMGGYLILHPRAEITVLLIFFFIQFVQLPAKVVLGIWFALQIFMSFTGYSSGGGVAWLAHVGGFIFGLVVLWLVTRVRGTKAPPDNRARVYRMDWS